MNTKKRAHGYIYNAVQCRNWLRILNLGFNTVVEWTRL
jgi:hypothetical protein